MSYDPLDLTSYLSLKAENEELKRKLANAIKAKSKYKRKWESLKPPRKSRRLEKNQRALDLIAKRESGELTITLKAISEQTGVHYGTLKHMAWEYRQAIK